MFRSLFRMKCGGHIICRSLILRKLEAKETSVLERGYDQTYVNKVRITSELDLFSSKNLDLLKTSIRIWIQAHPFLNCQIVQEKESNKYCYESLELNDYKWENVKFLKTNHSIKLDNIEQNAISDLLLDEYNLSPLGRNRKAIGGLLWRLAIFQLGDTYSYDVLLDIHHSISQARTSFKCLMQLFQIFENLHEKDQVKLSKYEVFPGAEAVFGYVKYLAPLPPIEIPEIRIASFLRAKANSQNEVNNANLNPDLVIFDAETGVDVFVVRDLIENSRNKHVGHRRLILDKDICSRFAQNIKLSKITNKNLKK